MDNREYRVNVNLNKHDKYIDKDKLEKIVSLCESGSRLSASDIFSTKVDFAEVQIDPTKTHISLIEFYAEFQIFRKDGDMSDLDRCIIIGDRRSGSVEIVQGRHSKYNNERLTPENSTGSTEGYSNKLRKEIE